MKNILASAALLVASAAATVNAASLSVVPTGSGATRAYSLYLNGAEDNGNFNLISLAANPTPPALFANPTTGNIAGAPRPAGAAFTYRNRMLDADPSEIPGGKGWSTLGEVTTDAALAFDTSPLGGTISTAGEPNGLLFLANFNIPTGGTGTATVTLFSGSTPIETLTTGLIPEPATFAMAGLGLVGIIAANRRRKA